MYYISGNVYTIITYTIIIINCIIIAVINFVFLHNRNDQSSSVLTTVAVYVPMIVSQLFTWIVFVIITSVMCHRRDNNNTIQQHSQFKKNLGILFLLLTFLGLPWLIIVTVSVVARTTNPYYSFQPAVVIIDALQGPALFVIRVARLREVRQFWKRLLCSKFNHDGDVQAHAYLN